MHKFGRLTPTRLKELTVLHAMKEIEDKFSLKMFNFVACDNEFTHIFLMTKSPYDKKPLIRFCFFYIYSRRNS